MLGRSCGNVTKLVVAVVLILNLILFFPPHGRQRIRASTDVQMGSQLSLSSNGWTRIIWQTSKISVEELEGETRQYYGTWQALNPDFKHVILTDERMARYVRENYGGSEYEATFFEINDPIVLSDLIRYLILLHDGGVYNDLDVGCEKPIDQWLPRKFANEAGVILGVEVDNNFGPDGRTFEDGEALFELVNWTIMAKANQPFMDFLVRRVFQNLSLQAQKRNTTVASLRLPSVQDVIKTTGPGALTRALFDYASEILGLPTTYNAFSKIQEPVLVGEVLVMPIHAFGAAHQVKWAGFEEDQSKVLVRHHFSGSWYGNHTWTTSLSVQ